MISETALYCEGKEEVGRPQAVQGQKKSHSRTCAHTPIDFRWGPHLVGFSEAREMTMQLLGVRLGHTRQHGPRRREGVSGPFCENFVTSLDSKPTGHDASTRMKVMPRIHSSEQGWLRKRPRE